MKDRLLRATFTGFFAVIIKDLVDFIYIKLGFHGVLMAKVAAGAFVAKEDINSPLSLILGYSAHFTVGGILGVAFLVLIHLSGYDYSIIKGLFFGAVVWLFLPGMLLSLGISSFVPGDISSNFMLLLDHLAFGLTLGLFFPNFVLMQSNNDKK